VIKQVRLAVFLALISADVIKRNKRCNTLISAYAAMFY